MGAVGDGVDQVCSGLKQSPVWQKPNQTKTNVSHSDDASLTSSMEDRVCTTLHRRWGAGSEGFSERNSIPSLSLFYHVPWS